MQIDYLNFENSLRNNERAIFSQSGYIHFVFLHPTEKLFKQYIKEKVCKKPPLNSCKYNNKRNEHNGWKRNKCFRCGSEGHFIVNFLKQDTLDKKVHCNLETHKTCVYRSTSTDKTLENSADQTKSQKICASMERVFFNVEIPRSNFGDSSQPTN